MENKLLTGTNDYTVGAWLDTWFQVYTTGLKASTVGLTPTPASA